MSTLNLRALASQLVRAARAQGVSSQALAAALERMTLHELAPGEGLYQEGDRSDSLHVLLEGEARVLVGPERQELVRLPAPTVIGQLGVLTGLPRSATVEAGGPARVARLADRDMWELLRGDSDAGVALRRLLLASMAQLVGQTGARLEDLVPAHGEPIPKDAPRIAAQERPARKAKARPRSNALTDAFSDSLVAELDEVRVVHTEADERRRFKD